MFESTRHFSAINGTVVSWAFGVSWVIVSKLDRVLPIRGYDPALIGPKRYQSESRSVEGENFVKSMQSADYNLILALALARWRFVWAARRRCCAFQQVISSGQLGTRWRRIFATFGTMTALTLRRGFSVMTEQFWPQVPASIVEAKIPLVLVVSQNRELD